MSGFGDSLRWDGNRGGALLAVLWFSVVLSAIAFALSRGVRTDFDRASLQVDSTKAYYLAHGAIEATLGRIVAGARGQDAEQPGFEAGQRYMRYPFSSGVVEVEIIGESGKLDVNQARPEAFARLLAASGVDGSTSVAIAAGIAAYREQLRRGETVNGMSRDQAAQALGNVGGPSTFGPVRASIQELEELLNVPGMTPEILYGAYREAPGGALVRLPGLVGNLTTRAGGGGAIDVNYASRELLLAAGLTPAAVDGIEVERRIRPLETRDAGIAGVVDDGSAIRLRGRGPAMAYTLHATAELLDSTGGVRARRTVQALVESTIGDGAGPIRIVRWWDTAF